jgi:hypothetical protein
VGALLDLAGDQRRTPEQPDQQRQDEEEHTDHGHHAVLAVELDGRLAAGVGVGRDHRGGTQRADAVVQAQVGEGVPHGQTRGDHEHGEQREADRGEQCLLAVLPPGEPDHAGTSHAGCGRESPSPR